MAPKSKAKAKAKADPRAKAKATAKAEPRGKATAKPAPRKTRSSEAVAKPAPRKSKSSEAMANATPQKRTADGAPKKTSSQEVLTRSKSTQALDKAKAAAASGVSRGSGGKRVVDSRVPNASSLSVHGDYSVKLNQTHIDANNNKYYIIQVLEGGGQFYAWNRWGRVGEPGQNKLMPCATSQQAIKEFEKKFREKTSNAWEKRDNFKPVNQKYTLVETEDAEGGDEQAPLGKLTEAQIGKGQGILDNIEAELRKSKPDKKQLEELSSDFYSKIPHNFGRNRPPAISTLEMLEAKVELLKFYLRMGFEEVEEDTDLTPVSGVMAIPLPASLDQACTGLCGKGDINASTKKGDDLAKKQAGNPTKKMSAAMYAAIMLYTANAIYRDLNQCLRDENRAKLKQYFKYLRLFFEAMACLPKRKVTLWRGLSVDLFDNPQYQVGSVVIWWGISSTTSDINVAKNFAKGCGGNCTVITIESETASDISDITFYSNEKESLLCPGTKLKVVSKKRNGNVTEITLKEVGRAIN